MKALVIGCGLIGSDYGEQSHAGVYKASERIQLIGGVDPDPKRRRAFEAKWHVPTYECLVDALEVDVPDVASICTPSSVRMDQVVILTDARIKAIWCEKPLAEKVPTGEAMVRLCADADVALQVNFQRRFDPLHQRAKALVSELGMPVHFDCRFSGDPLRVGCHAFDIFRWFVGQPMGGFLEDEFWPIVTTEAVDNPSTGTFTQVDIDDSTTIFDVDITGPKGRISLAAMGQQMLYAPTSESLVFPGVMEQRFHEVEGGGLAPAMACGLDSLLDHLEKGTPLLCTGEDGLAALRIHEAIR